MPVKLKELKAKKPQPPRPIDHTAEYAQSTAANAAHPGSKIGTPPDGSTVGAGLRPAAGPGRVRIRAAPARGPGKTHPRAGIGAAGELFYVWRCHAPFADQLLAIQPLSDSTAWNRTEYRPLEGFVYAVSPFNFTSIGGNLPTAPALLGNTVVYKPATQTLLVASLLQRLLEEAGLPPGVSNLVSSSDSEFSDVGLNDPHLAGIHFTGSTEVFQGMWQTVGANIGRYRTYPRLVGETGGKDFVMVHESADVDVLQTALIRGAFEYQAQKCSAASRAYLPESMWEARRAELPRAAA